MTALQRTADVVIIGAGVIGCSTAYHLTSMGIDDVAVLEMDQVGSGTSSKSASMLSLQFDEDELGIRMAQYSYSRYMQFETELGVPIDFKPIGWLSLATAETAAELRRSADLLQSMGVTTEVLAPEEISHRYPEINVDDIGLGTWGPDDGCIDPHMIMWGYIRRAGERGARLHQGVRATGIRVKDGRVESVDTEQGSIATRVVVNAAGPWAIEVGRWTGVEIPIVNLSRTVLVTGPLAEVPATYPFVEDVSAAWYCRPEGRGVLMGMGKEPVESLEVHVDQEMVLRMIETAVHRLPVLERAGVQTTWAGVRPMTPDDRPIVGPVPSVEGLVLNCGWDGVGFIQAPAAGQIVGELISDGRAATFDIEPLTIERFGDVLA